MERWQNKIAKAKDGTIQTERNGTPIQQRPTVDTSTSQSADRGDGTRTLTQWPWTLDDNIRRRPEMVRVSVVGTTLSLRVPGMSAPRARLLNDIRNNIHDRDLLGTWLHRLAGAIFYLSVPADNTMYSSCTPDGLCLPRAIKMALARADGLTSRDIPIRTARGRLQLATWIQEQRNQLADNAPPLYVQDNTPIPITGTLERLRRMSEWLLHTNSTSYPRTYADGSPNWGHSTDIIPILAGRGPDADPIALFEPVTESQRYELQTTKCYQGEQLRELLISALQDPTVAAQIHNSPEVELAEPSHVTDLTVITQPITGIPQRHTQLVDLTGTDTIPATGSTCEMATERLTQTVHRETTQAQNTVTTLITDDPPRPTPKRKRRRGTNPGEWNNNDRKEEKGIMHAVDTAGTTETDSGGHTPGHGTPAGQRNHSVHETSDWNTIWCCHPFTGKHRGDGADRNGRQQSQYQQRDGERRYDGHQGGSTHTTDEGGGDAKVMSQSRGPS
eukprot:gene36345-47303_t